MAKKGSKYRQLVYVKNQAMAIKLCELLSDLESKILLDRNKFGDYYVICFRANKDEFNTIKRGLNLQFKPVMAYPRDHNIWVYEHHESILVEPERQVENNYTKGGIAGWLNTMKVIKRCCMESIAQSASTII